MAFKIIESDRGLIKAWVDGVQVEDVAVEQLRNTAALPFIYKHLAVMPDCHWGMGATVGTVIATEGAIVPAAVGVDIGCGMQAVCTALKRDDIDPPAVRKRIERAVPHGRTNNGGKGDRGAWHDVPDDVDAAWNEELEPLHHYITEVDGRLKTGREHTQLGTLGGGNHFIEVCYDETDRVWLMLHSGSRGIGNRIGTHFIKLARQEMERYFIALPDPNLAYLVEGTDLFRRYMRAAQWAQRYARVNRDLMLDRAYGALCGSPPPVNEDHVITDCHHNYVTTETHFGRRVWVTRKGATRAADGLCGIIPGAMGRQSYIVRGLGNPDSFESCSHGAGRAMSRKEAKRRFTVEDHAAATEGVECKKGADVLDETPGSYKPIEDVMAAQRDLVAIEHTLTPLVCVKG